VLSFILSAMIQLISSSSSSPAHAPSHFVRTEVANGSVWADVWDTRDGLLGMRATTRLRDADPRLRFVTVDVDGDGRTDVVAYALDGRELQIWRATADGFAAVQ
jgi:hypothetical protein